MNGPKAEMPKIRIPSWKKAAGLVKPAVYIAALLAAGFTAEWGGYSLFQSRAPGRENAGATRVLIVGGSIMGSLQLQQLNAELTRLGAGNRFNLYSVTYPNFPSATLTAKHDILTRAFKPDLILLQAGCALKKSHPPQSTAIGWVKKKFLPSDTDFLFSFYVWLERQDKEKPSLDALVDLLEKASSEDDLIKLNEVRHGIKWKYLKRLSIDERDFLSSGILAILEKMVGRADYNDYHLRSITSLASFGYKIQATIRDDLDPIMGNYAVHEGPAPPSKVFPYLERLGEWIERGTAEIEKHGCEAFVSKVSKHGKYARYWLCAYLRYSKKTSNSLLDSFENVTTWDFMLEPSLAKEIDPSKIRSPTGRRLAEVMNKSFKMKDNITFERSDFSSSPDGVDPSLLQVLLDFVRTGRERGEEVWLLHYPGTRNPSIEALAARAGIHAVDGQSLFPEPLDSKNFYKYFVDHTKCGMGHVNSLGSLFWSRRIARDLMTFHALPKSE